jgi:NAD(P)-dependent dehydrogenase (short-subunit alcohol dehydrogenase family)
VSLAGRTAVVTGGASGIGRSIALALAADGAAVAILDLDPAGARRVAGEIEASGRRALAVGTDVSAATSVRAAAERVRGALGPVHVLVNDAGIAEFAPFLAMEESQWDRMIAVHLKGTYNCTRALAQDMVDARWGRIVNLSSVAGLGGGAGLAHYAAAKAGIIGFTKALAAELGPHGVTVNALAPGLIDTPMVRRAGTTEELIERAVRHTAVGRIGRPEDIAAACAYLVSEAAGFVTGQVLSPNGGAHV